MFADGKQGDPLIAADIQGLDTSKNSTTFGTLLLLSFVSHMF